MIDVITEKFMPEIDRQMAADENYKNISTEINEVLEKNFSEEKVRQIEEMIGRLIVAVENASAAAGIRLGAKMAAALFEE